MAAPKQGWPDRTSGELDEELADVLTAISVITKRLAKKINENLTKKEEKENVQALRPDRPDNLG